MLWLSAEGLYFGTIHYGNVFTLVTYIHGSSFIGHNIMIASQIKSGLPRDLFLLALEQACYSFCLHVESDFISVVGFADLNFMDKQNPWKLFTLYMVVFLFVFTDILP